jgi:hypothetical protein
MVSRAQINVSNLVNLRQRQMVRGRERRSKPYWNFWKVVFAGWLIRYPGKMFRIIGIPLGILIVMLYNAVK